MKLTVAQNTNSSDCLNYRPHYESAPAKAKQSNPVTWFVVLTHKSVSVADQLCAACAPHATDHSINVPPRAHPRSIDDKLLLTVADQQFANTFDICGV
jgi:hypothetical protein